MLCVACATKTFFCRSRLRSLALRRDWHAACATFLGGVRVCLVLLCVIALGFLQDWQETTHTLSTPSQAMLGTNGILNTS